MNRRPIQIAEPSLGDEEWHALREPLETGWLTHGPKVQAFEKAFAEKHQVEFAVAVTSCTTGLHLALVALGITAGDEVIIPAFTWIATANVVIYCGATPVFVDVDPVTFNLDPEKLAKSLTPRTKAIIPVHLFGLCANMEEIKAVLPKHIAVVEDAACAAGAVYKERMAGGLGDIGVFSFHPRKAITTGEGGMVTTNNPELAETLKRLRNHGASLPEEVRHTGPQPYLLPEFNLLGFNYRMTDLQGAIGLVQLTKLDSFVKERAYWANWYRDKLSTVNWLRLPSEPLNGVHAWQAFVCYVKADLAPLARNEIMRHFHSKGIATRPGTHTVPMLKYYRDRFGFKPEDFNIAYDCERQSMAIPLHNKMTLEDYEYVVKALKEL